MGKTIKLEKTNKLKKIQNRNKKTIFAVLDGGLFSKSNKIVLSPGDIINGDTLSKLSEVFVIKKYITFLSIKYAK